MQAPVNSFPEFRETYEEYELLLRPIVELFIRNNGANVSAKQLSKDIHDLYNLQKKLREVTS